MVMCVATIPPDHPTPDYDHLLVADEVVQQTRLVAAQLEAHDVSELDYFTRPLTGDHQLQSYHDLLVAACQQQAVTFNLIEIDPTDDCPAPGAAAD